MFREGTRIGTPTWHPWITKGSQGNSVGLYGSHMSKASTAMSEQGFYFEHGSNSNSIYIQF